MGKSLLITGANRGLGAVLAAQYLARGWEVLALARSGAGLPDGVRGVVADLSLDSARTILRAFLEKRGAPLDLLINNAGPPAATMGTEDAALEELVAHFQVHCAGVLRVVQAAKPFLLQAPVPLVVNISSRLASLTRMAAGEYADIHRSLSYPVAKAAQNMLTIQLHRELFPLGCRVVAVHPGALLTGYGSRDAATPVAEGAERLTRLVAGLGSEVSGVFLDPEGGVIPW